MARTDTQRAHSHGTSCSAVLDAVVQLMDHQSGPIAPGTRNGNKSHVVPLTCCVLTNQNKFNENPLPVNETLCYLAVSDSSAVENVHDYVYTEGCEPQLRDWIVSNAEILIGVAFGLAVIQLFGIVFACCVLKGTRSEYEYV